MELHSDFTLLNKVYCVSELILLFNIFTEVSDKYLKAEF